MLAVIIRQPPSRVQTAFILYDVFTVVYVMGMHLELIRADTVGEALSGLCVQYVGQAGFLMALLWFISEFAHIKVPAWLYVAQAVLESAVVAGVFTAEHHTLFYASMTILTDGMYHRIQVTDGILWRLHFVYVYLIVLVFMVLCIWQYQKGTHIQRLRILYIVIGIGSLALELTLKIIGVFGSYNPIIFAMVFNVFCMMMAMVKYSYFDSIHAAVDNAFDHGDEGLVILDREGLVIFINRWMERLFPDMGKGDNISGQEEIMEVLRSESRMMERAGAVYELRVENIIENGEKNGAVIWFIDQTEHLKIMRRLQEADAAKTQFLMKVSHELRTPMNTMLGMNEMIARESSEKRIQDYAAQAALAGEHMLALIEEVLDASRLESGNLELKKHAFCIGDLLENTGKLMRPQAERKGLIFRVQAEPGVAGRYLYGDEAHLFQVLTNLLSNAIKYTDSGSVTLKIRAAHREQGVQMLFFSVTDTGIGIREDEKQRIFESFERGSSAKKSEKDGMGLGLAIVKQLTEAMGGEITVRSAPDEGSEFSVAVPWEEVPADQAETGQFPWRDKAEAAAGQVSDFSGKTVLAVDDNANNLMVLGHLLRRTGLQLETAAGGRQAAEACRCKAYDLILLDHMMPSPDGMETLRLIREDTAGKNRNTPIIALTANATKGAEAMYAGAGFAGYLTKPVHADCLEETIRQHIGGRQDEFMDDSKIQKRMQLLQQHGIRTDDGLQYADGDIGFYQSLLHIFAKEQDEKCKKLDAALHSLPDAEAWHIVVMQAHGLKGESKGIGADRLGELFYQLELAGKAKDRHQIEAVYPIAVQEWQRVCGIINELSAASFLQ